LGDLPAGIFPFYSDGELVGAATNLGLVVLRDDVPTWYTQFSVHGDLYWYAYGGDERVVVGTSHGVLETLDWGCSWRGAQSGVPAVAAPAVLLDSAGERPVLVGTAQPGADNYLYASDDGGASWTRDDATVVSGVYVGLVRVPGGEAMAALTDGANGVELHWRSGPNEAWATRAVEVGGTEFRVLGLSSDASDLYISAFDGAMIETPSEVSEDAPPTISYEGTTWLYRLETSTGTAQLVQTLTDAIIGSGAMDVEGELWWTDSDDGLRHLLGDGGSSTDPGIGHCVLNPQGLGLVACGQRPQEYVFFERTDAGWEGVMLFDAIVGELCPDNESGDSASETDDETGDNTGDNTGDDTGATHPEPSEDDGATGIESSDEIACIAKDDMLAEGEGSAEAADSGQSDEVTSDAKSGEGGGGCQQSAGVSVIVLSLGMLVQWRGRRRRRA
jgi:hypothetical protein